MNRQINYGREPKVKRITMREFRELQNWYCESFEFEEIYL